MTIVSIEKYYLILDRGGAASVGELGHGLKPPVLINASIWCVVIGFCEWISWEYSLDW